MLWKISDGTTVELGGTIRGATVLAQRLRDQLPRATVAIWAHPSRHFDVHPNDPALLDAWLAERVEWWQRVRRLKLTLERPDGIPPLPPPPWAGREADEDGELVVY